MKKSVRNGLLTVLLIVLLAALAVFLFWLTRRLLPAVVPGLGLREKSASYAETLSEIRVDTDRSNITVTPVSGDRVTLRWQDLTAPEYRISRSDGVLTVSRQSDAVQEGRTYWVEVGIPEGFSGALTLKTDSGKLRIAGVGNAGVCALTVGTGSIDLESSTFSALTASAESGNLYFDDCVCGTAALSAVRGDFSLKNTEILEGLSFTSEEGDAELYLPGRALDYVLDAETVNGDRDVIRGGRTGVPVRVALKLGNLTVALASDLK